jgi:hypothetical protein
MTPGRHPKPRLIHHRISANFAFILNISVRFQLPRYVQVVVLTSVDAAVRWCGAPSHKGRGSLSSPALATLPS